MSIVRIGLAETKGFAEGYDAIFGKKKEQDKAQEAPAPRGEEKKDEPSAGAAGAASQSS
jgi:hypothetical protein